MLGTQRVRQEEVEEAAAMRDGDVHNKPYRDLDTVLWCHRLLTMVERWEKSCARHQEALRSSTNCDREPKGVRQTVLGSLRIQVQMRRLQVAADRRITQ